MNRYRSYHRRPGSGTILSIRDDNLAGPAKQVLVKMPEAQATQ